MRDKREVSPSRIGLARLTRVLARNGTPALKPHAGRGRGFAESDGLGRFVASSTNLARVQERDRVALRPNAAMAVPKGLPAWISCNSLAIRRGVGRASQEPESKVEKTVSGITFRRGAFRQFRHGTMSGQLCDRTSCAVPRVVSGICNIERDPARVAPRRRGIGSRRDDDPAVQQRLQHRPRLRHVPTQQPAPIPKPGAGRPQGLFEGVADCPKGVASPPGFEPGF